MNRDTFDDAINWLARYFNYNLSAERLERYWDDFQREPDDIFASVVANDIPTKLKSFPSPQELREAVSFARERAYGASRAKTLSDHRPVEKMLSKTKHGAELAEIVERLYAHTGPAARMRYLTDMRSLHDKYPKAGYLAAADEMENDWLKRGVAYDTNFAQNNSEATQAENNIEPEIVFIEPSTESD